MTGDLFVKPPSNHPPSELLLYRGRPPRGVGAGRSGAGWAGARRRLNGTAGDDHSHSLGVVGLISSVHGTLWVSVAGR